MKVPPGPRGLEVLRFFGRSSDRNPLTFLRDTARRYGPISYFRILHKHVYVIDDADLVKEVLVTQQHGFERDTGATLLRELLGDALITREEPLHRERRRVLQPAFHREQIAHYAEIMSAESARFADEWTNDETINVREEMRRLTLAIAGNALFGTDCRESADEVSAVLQRVTAKTRWVAPLMILLEPFFLAYRRRFPKAPSIIFGQERAQLEAIISPILEQRRGGGTKDILSLILNARNEEDAPLTDDEVRNEIVTFMLAGHETTATALTWTLYLLAQNPSVAECFYQELDMVLGAEPARLEDVPRLPYASAVFQEGMRLYPPALAFARKAIQAVELAGYVIPRGASVFVSPYITQRNPRYFIDPEQFRPERWLHSEAPAKFAYFPFGGGAKMCIGESFARLEGVLALTNLGRKWRISCSNGDSIAIGVGMLLRPDRAILLQVSERTHAGQEAPSL